MVKIKKARGSHKGAKVAPLPADQVAALLKEAGEHRAAGRYDQAVPIYERLERSNPMEGGPPYYLALIDLAQGRVLS